jgi:outer membrane protein assembly factor BamB
MSKLRVDGPMLVVLAGALAFSRPTAALADDWPAQGRDAARSSASAERSGAAFSDGSWTSSLPKRVTTVSSPAVADDRVVFGAFDGVVRALRPSDGALAWEHKLGDAIYAAPTVYRGRVFVPALDKKIYALRLQDGATLWTKDLGGLAMGSPTIVDGALIVAPGFPARSIVKLDPATGKELWATPANALAQFSNSAAAAAGDQLVVGANDGRYRAFDLATGRLRWTYEADGVVNLSAPVIVGGGAYMLPGGASRRLHGVDVQTGVALPGFPLELPFPAPDVDGRLTSQQLAVSSLALAQERLVFDVRKDDAIDSDGNGAPDRYLLRELVMAVDPATGRVAWQQANGRSILADPNDIPKFWLCPTPATFTTDDGSVLVAAASTLAPALRILDGATGAERWTTPLAAPAQASPVLANGQLVVATRAGVQGFRSSANHPPSAPSLVAPVVGLGARSPWIRWSPSSDPEGDALTYAIRLGHDGDVLQSWEHEILVPAAAQPASSAAWPETVAPGATYTVAMRARDTRGALSAWSAPVALTAPDRPQVLVDGRRVGSLPEAARAAAPGSIIELGSGVTFLTETLPLPPGAVLRGAGAGTTVLQGAGVGTALRLAGGEGTQRTRVSRLTIRRARTGIAVEARADVEVLNVIVQDCADAGMDVAVGGNADLRSATLVRNGTAVRSAGAARVRNSILTGNHTALWAAEPGRLVSRHNDLYANDEAARDVATGPGDMSDPVTFADATHDDFRLLGPQASTDRGDPADAVGDEPVPNGGRINLGAFGGTSDAERSPSPSAAVFHPVGGGAAAPSADERPAAAQAGCSVAGDASRPASAFALLAITAVALVGRRRRAAVATAAGLALLLAGASSRAATVIWGGGSGTWGTAANWIGGAAPGASDTASFTGWAPLDRSGWTLTASVGASPSNTKDGKWNTRWTTGTNAASGQWYKIDLGSTQTFGRIVLDDTGDGSDYPPGYDVYVSSDGATWGSAVASGTGSAPLTTINFTSQTARYIKVQLNAAAAHWWSIRETFVYTTASTGDTQLARNGWTATASNNSGSAALAIDSALSTRWDTGTNAATGQWFKVDLGTSTVIDRVDFSSYTDDNDYPPSYTVAVSTDDVSYSSVASGSPSAAFVSATFTAQTARYVKVTCTAAGTYYFSIHDFNVYGTPRPASIASSISITGLTLAKGTVTQSSGASITLSGAFSQSGGTFTGGDSAVTAASFALSAGSFTSTSGTLTVSGTFSHSGGTFTASSGAVTCSSTASAATIGTDATYTLGSGTHTFSGGLSVGGTLAMATAGGTLAVGSNKTLTIDGTLNASSASATIQSAGGAGTHYTFKVGSTATATPTLNISALSVKNTDMNGMWINANASAVTTFMRFDNIAFSNGTGTRLLQIYATSLYLSSNGCTFDSGAANGTTAYNVTLTGNGTSDGETRVVFGGARCATDKTPCASYKQDDDAGNGTAATPASNGAVAQFISSVATDTAGTVVGFPTAAIDWNTFAFYSVYVTFHDANGTADRIYVRDGSGAARYRWETPAGEVIIGTPRWETVGNVHYLYVATTSGKVYRLIDDTTGLSLAPDPSAPWNGTDFDCGCTISTPLTMDTNNLYWAGSVGGVYKLWTLGKTTQTQPSGSPLATSSTVGSAAPAIWSSGNSYVFLGMPGRISKVDVTAQANVSDNTNPGGTTAVNGRITIMSGTLYAGDDNGYLWALDAGNNFAASSGTYKYWSYHDATNHASCGGVCGIQSIYRDYSLGRVYYGDQDGHVYVVDNTGAAVTGFPYRPGSSSDAFTTSALYVSGVIVIGSSTGTLYIIDQNSNGSAPALIQMYKFGSTTQISGVAYDTTTASYLVSTADPAAKDGKLYYISAVSDPTPSYR